MSRYNVLTTSYLFTISILFNCVVAQECFYTPPPKPVYRVQLDYGGPEPSFRPTCPFQLPSCQTAAIDQPILPLPAYIPASKVVSASAYCIKTVVKPQSVEQIITLPVISKYLQTFAKPRIEVITYNAIPICPPQPSRSLPCSANNPSYLYLQQPSYSSQYDPFLSSSPTQDSNLRSPDQFTTLPPPPSSLPLPKFL